MILVVTLSTLALYDNANSTTNWREQHLYGSSRLGMWLPGVDLNSPTVASDVNTAYNTVGNKILEVTDHLQNVKATITNRPLQHSSDGINIDYFTADLATSGDNYPFGLETPGRQFTTTGNNYRYGFNNKERDKDIQGNDYQYGFRIYNPQTVTFLSTDPLQAKYPWFTPYQFSGNNPILNIDLDGLENYNYNLVQSKNSRGEPVLALTGPQKQEEEGGIIGFLHELVDVNTGQPAEHHNLYFKGDLIASFSSAQELKTVAHGRTVPEIKKIGAEIAQGQNEPKAYMAADIAKHTNDAVTSIEQSRRQSIDENTNTQSVSINNGNPGAADANTEAVQKVNGRNPRNYTYAGKNLKFVPNTILSKKYPNGVNFDSKGFPDFAPYALKTVDIGPLNTNSSSDISTANKMAGYGNETPANFVWHHVPNSTKLELIPTDLHSAVAHTGGRATNKPQ